MISTIIWNIRGVKSKGTFERLKFLSRIHNTDQIIAIQEPFVDACHMDKYRKGLGFEGCSLNCNGKIVSKVVAQIAMLTNASGSHGVMLGKEAKE